jgi:hypothetical protein
MFTPGAKRSRQGPKLENGARLSPASVAPTVIACGDAAGETVHASPDALPALTTGTTP